MVDAFEIAPYKKEIVGPDFFLAREALALTWSDHITRQSCRPIRQNTWLTKRA